MGLRIDDCRGRVQPEVSTINEWLTTSNEKGTKLPGSERSWKRINTTLNRGSQKIKVCFDCRCVDHLARECKPDESKTWRRVLKKILHPKNRKLRKRK